MITSYREQFPEGIEEPARVKLTRQMVHTLLDSGVTFDGAFELINGDILYKMGRNYPHIVTTNKTLRWIYAAFGIDHVITQESIVASNFSEPEPDIAVLNQPIENFAAIGIPTAADILLVVEVSDSTLPYDRTTKAILYASAEIPEYWVIDVTGRQIIVHRDPAHSAYQTVRNHPETDSIAALAAPNLPLLISTILP